MVPAVFTCPGLWAATGAQRPSAVRWRTMRLPRNPLLARGALRQTGGALELTDAGRGFVTGFGIDLDGLPKSRAPLCRECLDWSERRSHLAVQLGRAMFSRMEALGWATRVKGTRVVRFSTDGAAAFAEVFGGGLRQG